MPGVPWGQRGVASGRVDGAMAQIGLQRSGSDALICHGIAAGMPEHVRVDLEANLGFVAGPREQLGKA